MALILTRRIGESLMIGDNVQVSIIGATGNRVRIAIEADRDTAVHREEIWKRVQRERGSSTETPMEKAARRVC